MARNTIGGLRARDALFRYPHSQMLCFFQWQIIAVPPIPRTPNANSSPLGASDLNAKQCLQSLVCVETDGRHWYDLHVANREADEKAGHSPFFDYQLGRFDDA